MTDLDVIMAKMQAQEAMTADLRDRMDRAEAETVTLHGMVKALGGRVLALESDQPSPAMDRAHQGLRNLQEKVEAANPERVKGHEQEKFEARERAAEKDVS